MLKYLISPASDFTENRSHEPRQKLQRSRCIPAVAMSIDIGGYVQTLYCKLRDSQEVAWFLIIWFRFPLCVLSYPEKWLPYFDPSEKLEVFVPSLGEPSNACCDRPMSAPVVGLQNQAVDT